MRHRSFTALDLDSWLTILQGHWETSKQHDAPYYAPSPEMLVTTSLPNSFTLGTGSQVLSNVFSKCLQASHELILVTCFWAPSASQESLSSLLLKLSAKAISQGRMIRVRICFSSLSLSQKLFHTSSLDGEMYPPSSWTSLRLPEASELEGLELVVKSVFVRPFSVMHPKFILVDRKLAFMPSCNISWEDWFEGCIEIQGQICERLFDFYSSFWSRGVTPLPQFLPSNNITTLPPQDHHQQPLLCSMDFPKTISPVITVLLPSPHHSNPKFCVTTPPPTPLNTFILHAITTAKHSIFIQTPNLTSYPVVAALFSALESGINIHLITSSRLMIIEQLVTAGTITELEVWKFQRRYNRIISRVSDMQRDLERPVVRPGKLTIGYFKVGTVGGDSEPVKSHLKCCIIDESITVLGSGNMDRASWFTSQELGIAFLDRYLATEVRKCIDKGVEGRVEYVC